MLHFLPRKIASVFLKGAFAFLLISSEAYAQEPPNDECPDAIEITPNPDGYHRLYPVSDSTIGATTSLVVPICNTGTGGRKDVWYKFVAIATSHRLTRQHTAIGTGITTPGIAVYHADICDEISSLTSVYCSAIGTDINLGSLVIGDTYYVQLYANGTGNPNFRYSLWLGTAPDVPSNDECASSSDISDGGIYIGETDAATSSMAASDCGWGPSLTSKDVWYSFTAPTTGDVTFSVAADPYKAFVLQVFNSCATTGAPIACSDETPTIVTVSDMSVGQTVFMRVHGFDVDGAFTIQASGVALPVEMGPLEGIINEEGFAVLKWHTYREENNKGFEIERSADGRNFQVIGFEPASQYSGGYNWTDGSAISGTVFYRLCQLDAEGKRFYSDIISLTAPEQHSSLTAYQSPAGLHVFIPNGIEVGGWLYLADLNGRVLHSKYVTKSDEEVDVHDLSAGMYVLRYIEVKGSVAIKVLISKNF